MAIGMRLSVSVVSITRLRAHGRFPAKGIIESLSSFVVCIAFGVSAMST